MKPYHERIDKTIIQILYNNEKLSSGKLKAKLDDSLVNDGDNKTVPDTYWGRLRRLTAAAISSNNKQQIQQSKYAIQPVLIRHEKIQEGNLRGANVYYSLAKHVRTRCDLKLPILMSEDLIEKAYRILFRYLAFDNSPYKKLEDESEYKTFLQKLEINQNELQFDGKQGFNKNLYKVTKWIHKESEIRISHIEYLKESENYGNSEYYYQLPGISINEFIANKESELAYGHLDFKDNEVNEYFKILEDKKLVKKIKSRYLIILNEEDRYIIVDNKDGRLKMFLKDCWLLHGTVTLYLIQKWKSIQKPTREERIGYGHLWGKERSDQIFKYCYQAKIKFNKSKNVKSEKEDIQKLLKSQIIGLQRKFESIKNTYPDIIEDYSYLANPLLNLVYPQYFRN